MGRPSRLTDDERFELADYALRSRGKHPFWPSTEEICTYAFQRFGVSYGHRAMHKILVALGLKWQRHTNSWRLPR
jgi:transposase